MKKLFYSVVLLLISISGFGQFKVYNTPGLRPGDQVPDVKLSNIVNYAKTEAQFSEFSGKLIILDFWDVTCSSCIAAFPKMEQLQREFGEQVQILLVARSSVAEVDRLLKNNRYVRNTNLPILKHDTVLHKLFPHAAVPYHVWIDKEGRVRVMAGAEATTSGNIRKALLGATMNLPTRIDEINEALLKKPLLEQMCGSPAQMGQLQSYSLFTKRSKLTQQSINAGTIPNSTIIQLAQTALNYWESGGKVIVEMAAQEHISKYFPPLNEDEAYKWTDENTYCYELKLPPYILQLSEPKQIQKQQEIIRQDCERFFNVRMFMEERDVPCLILFPLTAEAGEKLLSRGGESHSLALDHTWTLTNIHHSLIDHPLRNFRKFGTPEELPFINEVPLNGNIDLKITEGESLESYNRQLVKYGMKLKIESRKVKCLIIKENDDL